ncbi:MAG: hypothetical protein Q9207_000045 [Kuettlingeria erythrocarpa]
MLHSLLLVLVAILTETESQSDIIFSGSNTLPTIASSSTSVAGGDLIPTGAHVSYRSLSSTTTLFSGNFSGGTPYVATTIAITNNSTVFDTSTSTTSFTLLQGSQESITVPSATTNASSPTSTSVQSRNTQPCNNYPELCTRKYSNITQVAAHNSPFVAPQNAAANQALGVIDQLNDGIRMLQGQTHILNGTLYYCHTSCNILNSGTAESYFASVARWVKTHPYDVVTLLIGNGDLVNVNNYTAPLQSSGLARFAYIPPKMPMAIEDWPTLSEMILMQKRVVIFMDYNANQTAVPYVLDEFSQVWETPFSPTNRSFPCTQQRPPDMSTQDAGQRMYLANHNLNTEITLLGISILVVTVTLLNETNNVTGFGSLGAMASDCSRRWSRPPNFLLVDFYNVGAGSVFEVAAEHNNVTYKRDCCGFVPSLAVLSRYNIKLLAVTIGCAIFSALA